MAFPNDLSDVVVFKIHPAIGIARVSNNDDYYVFGTAPENYKSNKLIKRQAVQFRVFAYGENHVGLGELTPQVMSDLGISSVWSAEVANRKIARLEGTPLSGTDFVVRAKASSDVDGGKLVGELPSFAEGGAIPLGEITPDGLFIPPKGDVYRKSADSEILPFPALSTEVADTSCDGSVTVRLTRNGSDLDVLPACIVVAPQDFSPDTDEIVTLYDWLQQELQVPTGNPGNLHNQTAHAIDEAAIRPVSPRFDPGFEVCLEDFRSEVVDVKQIFYQSNQDPRIDPREMRVRYRELAAPTNSGAVPGQLTSGLCSSWQGDFTACVGYWAEHLPEEAYLDENTSTDVRVFRKEYANTSFNPPRLTTGEDFNSHVDKVGVVRLVNGKKVETERDPGDDIG